MRASGLRAVGQRNPLVEYKREAFDAFETLLGTIKSDIATMILNVRLQTAPVAPRSVHYNGTAGGTAQPKRGNKVGRNDLCPCGSGKKFKNCCLREGLSPEQAAAKAASAKRPS